jgi:acyl carrier protein
MAADHRYQRIYKNRGLRPFSIPAGVRAFFRALSCNAVQLSIVGLDPSCETEVLADLNRVPSTVTAVPPPRGLADLTECLKAIIARHLHCPLDKIAHSTPFKDLGIDSLMAVEIALDLQRLIGVRIYPTLLLELRTMTDLVDQVRVLTEQDFGP